MIKRILHIVIMQKDSSEDKPTGEKWVDVVNKKKPIEKRIRSKLDAII